MNVAEHYAEAARLLTRIAWDHGQTSLREDANTIAAAQVHATLALLPGRSEAVVKAEALREFADTRGVNVGDEDSYWWDGYRQAQRECLHDALTRSARIEREGS